MEHIEARKEREDYDPAFAEEELALQRRMQQEAREKIEALRLARSLRGKAAEGEGDDDDFDDDDYDDDDDVEVVYAP